MSDERTLALDYALAQGRAACDVVATDGKVQETIVNVIAQADAAYDQLVAHGIPPVYAASFIVGALNARLLTRLVEPPT